MSSQTSEKEETTGEVMPIKEMGSHTYRVEGIVHLPGGQRIMTCSWDGSLRVWDLKSGMQIDKDWRDDKANEAGVYCSIALSPNGKTVISGSRDGKVKLWDVETGKVIQRWTGHTNGVFSVCWSAGGNRVVSGSGDGTAKVWNVKTGKTILEIKTGHEFVYTVKYTPNDKQIATGGFDKSVAQIWNAKTGKLIKTLKHDTIVCSLSWTSDGKKLITASRGPIRIFDTATWEQIAILEGHKNYVNAISLSHNNRLLASVSDDKTARIWNLDTNFPVGPPLQHKDEVYSTAFSANGRVLVTGANDKNAYAWDVNAIYKQAGLEDLLPTSDVPMNILEQISQGKPAIERKAIERTPPSSLSDKSFLEADATRGYDEFGGFDELSPRFFDRMEANDDSSPTGGAHPHSSASAFLARLTLLLHRFRHDSDEPSQPLTLSGLHPRILFARLSSLIHRSPAETDASNELQQPSRLHLHAILASLSSLFPRSQLNTEETESHTVTPSRPDAVMSLLSSLFRSRHHTNEEIELSQRAMRPHVVDVAPMRDKEALFVAERAQADRPHHQSAGAPHSRPIRLLGHIGLYLCCVCDHQRTDSSAQPTQQQQGQSQGPVLTQALSLQTIPAALSTSTTSPVPTTTPAAATA